MSRSPTTDPKYKLPKPVQTKITCQFEPSECFKQGQYWLGSGVYCKFHHEVVWDNLRPLQGPQHVFDDLSLRVGGDRIIPRCSVCGSIKLQDGFSQPLCRFRATVFYPAGYLPYVLRGKSVIDAFLRRDWCERHQNKVQEHTVIVDDLKTLDPPRGSVIGDNRRPRQGPDSSMT